MWNTLPQCVKCYLPSTVLLPGLSEVGPEGTDLLVCVKGGNHQHHVQNMTTVSKTLLTIQCTDVCTEPWPAESWTRRRRPLRVKSQTQ